MEVQPLLEEIGGADNRLLRTEEDIASKRRALPAERKRLPSRRIMLSVLKGEKLAWDDRRRTRGAAVLETALRLRLLLFPRQSRREAVAKLPFRLARAFYCRINAGLSIRSRNGASPPWLLTFRRFVAPPNTLRERLARRVWRLVFRFRAPAAARFPTPPTASPASQPALDIGRILDANKDRKGIVVCLPFIDWTWMRQRPHQLMAEFAKAGYLSLFCSPKCRTDVFEGFVRVADRLYLCDSLAPLYDLPDCLVLVGWTGHSTTIKQFASARVIYDYLDDLGVSSEGGLPDRHKLETHRQLVTESEIVLATARRLHNEVKKLRPDAIYCPNGVEYEHFHRSTPPPVPADIADLVAGGRPIIGYFGALARWFDYHLVEASATARKDYEFLLIGPDFDGTLSRHKLTDLPNVRWVGEKKYEELPAYLYYFTVATIPFLVNEITQATSPVKLFEYMAGNRPIVTTDMPECRAYDSVLVARDRSEYIGMLDEAIRRRSMDSFRGLLEKEACENTWQERVRQILTRAEMARTPCLRRSA
jgi:glycosyltransferase involved in cell wall biosynthesis